MAKIDQLELPNGVTYDFDDKYARKLTDNDFDTINVTELNAGDLIVTGVGRFTNGLYGNLTGNADTASSATKATQDESGNNIKATYANTISISDHTITLKNKNGTSLGTVTVPDNNTTYTVATGTANGKIKVTPSSGSAYEVSVYGLKSAAYKDVTDTYSATGIDPVSGKAVAAAIDALPEPMVFKGSLGTGGTITALPTDGTAKVGDTYKVITAGTYASKAAKVGDTFICLTKTSSANTWELIPSGDEPSGTVTSVAVSNGGGLSVSGSPITTSGTITISHADTSSQASVNNSGRTYIQDITLDTYGHVTGIASATETVVNTDRYVNSAAFADATSADANNPLKMTLTRAGSDTASVTAYLPKISSSSAGIVPKGTAVSSQSQSTKFLREDGTWAAPTYTVNTDTKVTAVGNHYAPAENAGSQLDADASSTTAATWNSTSLVTGVTIKRDAKGHVTGLAVDSIKMPANPNTNTTYTFAEGSTNGAFSVTPSGGSAQSVSIHGLKSAAYTESSAYATSGHTHSTSIASSTDTSEITLAHNGVYELTAGGTSFVFKMPSSGNTDTKVRQTLVTDTGDNTNRPLLLAYSNTSTTTGNVDNISYRANTIYANAFTGTITAPKFVGALDEANLTWGGKSLSGSVTPIGVSLSMSHNANRLAFINGDLITSEFSADNGSTWTAHNLTTSQKSWFFTDSVGINIGKQQGSTEACTLNSKTRITITAQDGTNPSNRIYISPKKMLINVSSANGLSVLVEYRTGTNYLNDGAWSTFGTYSVSGWSGWNDIPLVLSTLGGDKTQTANVWQLRLTFSVTSLSTNESYRGSCSVTSVRIFSDNVWLSPSTIASTNHLYSYNTNQDAVFPAAVTATGNIYEAGTLLSNKYSAIKDNANYVRVKNSLTVGRSSDFTFNDLAKQHFAMGMIYSGIDNPTGTNGWYHGISMAWEDGVNTSWVSQIAVGVDAGTGIWYRTNSGTIIGRAWKRILDESNYDTYTVKKDGTGASGTWGISISGNADTATTANNLAGFTNTANSATAIDSATQNGHVYVSGTSGIYGITDGACFVQAYNTNWIAQIYQDYRTGQIALRGKNNGTWQDWRKVWDSVNLTSKTAAASGTDLSLVTTGEKATWNAKGSGTITSVKTTAGAHTTINVTSGAANFNVPTKTSHLTNDSGFVTTDTKNTAGSTDSSSKLFIVGATSQAANPQTYSQDTAYVGTDGHLYSDSKQVVNLSGSQALTNKTYNGYTLGAACAKGVDTTVTENSDKLVTSGAVFTAIENLPEPMVFKGTVGSSSATVTWANLPTAATGNTGYTYKVDLDHATSPICKSGDTIISNGSAWVVIPSGDEPSGTVTSVAISNGGGLSVSGSPITSSGTITISHADTSSQASVNNSGRTYIQDITLDTYGHVTGISSATETVTNTTYTIGMSGNTVTLTPSSGSVQSITVPYATSAGSATKATQDSDGNAIRSTYLKKTGDSINVLGISQSAGTSGGISLYQNTNYVDNYGIAFRLTSNLGKHGYVQSDWATYFTMDGSDTRGWVFRNAASGKGNVASISSAGHAVFGGSVTVGGNTTNTSGCRQVYNETTNSLDFVFL